MSSVLPVVPDRRSPLTYLCGAVLLFLLFAGLGLGGMLLLAHVPLGSADPFHAFLAPLWLIVAGAILVPLLGLGHLWYRAHHQHRGLPWTMADLKLGVVLAVLGLLAGHIQFQIRYAKAQAVVTAQMTDQFMEAFRQAGLSRDGLPTDVQTFDEHGRIMWAAGPGQCPVARAQWDRLDASWNNQKSGGATTAGALEATFLRTLWFHGCLTDPDYVQHRQDVAARVAQAQARLSHEGHFPVLAWSWPVQTWAQVRASLADQVPLRRQRWCEDQLARAGTKDADIQARCRAVPNPTAPVVQPTDAKVVLMPASATSH